MLWGKHTPSTQPANTIKEMQQSTRRGAGCPIQHKKHTQLCGGVWCVAHTAGVLQSGPDGNHHSAAFDCAAISRAVV